MESVFGVLDDVAPEVPMIAFGQTPFWDETLKAIVAARTRRPCVMGIHDLDYFSRLRAVLPGSTWPVIPRNDNSLKDPWIAAGELSALFGAEAAPTRQTLAETGVRLDMALPCGAEAREKALDQATEAWGWRGIVRNSLRDVVLCDVPFSDVRDAFAELLTWGGCATARRLARPAQRRHVHEYVKQWIERFDAVLAENRAVSLSEAFQRFYGRMVGDLLGDVPDNMTVACTRDLFRFNRATFRHGRFSLVEAFLGGALAQRARAAYDAIADDSSRTSLAELGPDATPFDVYAPGRGRGTLHIADRRLRIDFPKPLDIPLKRSLRSLCGLAGALEEALGDNAALFGKAVMLPLLFGGEFIHVLTETGSAYMPDTHRLARDLRTAGWPLELYPLVRLKLRTWDSLAATGLELALPPHLENAFQSKRIMADRFSRTWKRVVQERKSLLSRLGRMPGPCAFVEHLGHDVHEKWFKRLERGQPGQRLPARRAAPRGRPPPRGHGSAHGRGRASGGAADPRTGAGGL